MSFAVALAMHFTLNRQWVFAARRPATRSTSAARACATCSPRRLSYAGTAISVAVLPDAARHPRARRLLPGDRRDGLHQLRASCTSGSSTPPRDEAREPAARLGGGPVPQRGGQRPARSTSGCARRSSAAEVDYEIIFSLDPCTDATEDRIREIRLLDPRVKMLRLSRRFGQPAATLAGIRMASGDAVVVIDCDLQDPPELIGDMIGRWSQGFDVVYAQRRSRAGETLPKRIVAALGYRVIRRVAEVEIPPNTGDFRLMSRRVVDEVLRLNETHGFLRGLTALVGLPPDQRPLRPRPPRDRQRQVQPLHRLGADRAQRDHRLLALPAPDHHLDRPDHLHLRDGPRPGLPRACGSRASRSSGATRRWSSSSPSSAASSC